MTVPVIAAISAVLLALVGVAGTVVPVLPGSITVAAGLLVWAIWGGSGVGWIVFGIGLAFVLAGMIAQYVLTGRTLRRRAIPSRSVMVGALTGAAGFFLIPVVGLPLGFAVGLFGSEWARVQDAAKAVGTSLAALKSVGIGMLVEFGCASAATMTLGIGIAHRFLAG